MNFIMSDVFKKIQYWSYGRITQTDNVSIHNTSSNVIPKISDPQLPNKNIHYTVDNKVSFPNQTQQISSDTNKDSKIKLNNDKVLYIDNDIFTNFNLDQY